MALREGSPRALIEATLPKVQTRFRSEAELFELYRAVLRHSWQLRKGDDLWAWLEQVGLPAEPVSEPLPQDVAAELGPKLEALMGEKPTSAGLASRVKALLIRGVGSLWVPSALAYSLVLLTSWGAHTDWRFDSRHFSTGLCLALGLALGLLASMLLGPWIQRWRRSLHTGMPMVTSVLTALACLTVLPFIAGTFRWLVSLSEPDQSFGWRRTLSKTLELVCFSDYGPFGPGYGVGLALVGTIFTLWACLVVAKSNPWVLHRAQSPWRKLMSVALLLPFFYNSYPVISVVKDGRQLDPALLPLISDPAELPKEWVYLSGRQEGDHSLAMQFLEEPLAKERKELLEWEPLAPDQAAGICARWLEIGRPLWEQKQWWKDPRFELFLKSLEMAKVWKLSKEPPTSMAELEVRSRRQFHERYREDTRQWVEGFAELDLTTEQWQEIAELLTEAMSAQGERLEEVTEMKSYFGWHYQRWSKDQARFSFYGLMRRQAQLNRLWWYYQAHLQELDQNPVWTPEMVAQLPPTKILFEMEPEFGASNRHLMAPSLGRMYHQKKVRQSYLRGLTYSVLAAQVQALLAGPNTAELPRSVAEIPGKVGAALQPYQVWLVLEVSGEEVKVGFRSADGKMVKSEVFPRVTTR